MTWHVASRSHVQHLAASSWCVAARLPAGQAGETGEKRRERTAGLAEFLASDTRGRLFASPSVRVTRAGRATRARVMASWGGQGAAGTAAASASSLRHAGAARVAPAFGSGVRSTPKAAAQHAAPAPAPAATPDAALNGVQKPRELVGSHILNQLSDAGYYRAEKRQSALPPRLCLPPAGNARARLHVCVSTCRT
jgi:hypothetical protein